MRDQRSLTHKLSRKVIVININCIVQVVYVIVSSPVFRILELVESILCHELTRA